MLVDGKNEFYKENDSDAVWWKMSSECIGDFEFSFDRKTIFNLFQDYPYKLSAEQKNIFDKENPFWADFFSDRK